MLRKFFSIVICLISIVLLLAACQNEVPENAENDVPAENVNDGTLYTPEYAFEQGFVTAEDIRSMAYYYHGGREYSAEDGYIDTDYIPIRKDPENIDEATVEKIRETTAEYCADMGVTISAKDLEVADYCGTYNGYIAVRIQLSLPQIAVVPNDVPIEVGGVTIDQNPNSPLMLWK